MKREQKRDILRLSLYVVWGMITLILLCCVILLAIQMAKAGRNPMVFTSDSGGLSPRRSLPQDEPGAADVTLFFAGEEGRLLVPQRRQIQFGDRVVENCRRALNLLIEGPQHGLTPILPSSTRIRAVYLLDDELVIDFSRELALDLPKSASAEALMIYGVVNTLTQRVLAGPGATSIRRIRFLVEGSPPKETFPAHLDLSSPVSPDPRWIRKTATPQAAADAFPGDA